MKKLWASPHLPLVITLLMLVALFSTASVMYEGFFSGRVAANLIGDNASLGIAAIGMTLVILSGGIDLSVGAVLGFTTIFVAVMIQRHHLPPLLAIALSLGVGTFLGLGMGFLIDRFDLPPFLVTLGGMFFARGLGFMVSPESVGIDHPFYNRLSEFTIPLGGKAALSATAVAYLAVFAAGIFVTHQSAFGQKCLCVGRQRIFRAADGGGRRPDQTGGLCHQRILRGAGGRGFHCLSPARAIQRLAWDLNWT